MREAFATGYAEHGPLPVPRWVKVACETAIGTPGATPQLLEAAGRIEGRRAALQRRRQKIYDSHRAPVMAAALILANNVHVDDMVRACRTQLGETTKDQRPAVKAAGAAILTRTLAHTDGLNAQWQTANADAVVESRAEGHAEAAASTMTGGPADPTHVAALYGAAAAGLATALSWKTADEWTTAQVDGLAGDIADSVKTGLTDDELRAAITTALQARVGVAYYLEELMHAGYAFGFQVVAQSAGVQAMNFQTCDDERVCATCDSYEGANPWTPDTIPQPPVHGGCRCALEYADQTLTADVAA